MESDSEKRNGGAARVGLQFRSGGEAVVLKTCGSLEVLNDGW